MLAEQVILRWAAERHEMAGVGTYQVTAASYTKTGISVSVWGQGDTIGFTKQGRQNETCEL